MYRTSRSAWSLVYPLKLAGVGPAMKEQLERTGLLATLGEDAVVGATETAYGSCQLAERRGRDWLCTETAPPDSSWCI